MITCRGSEEEAKVACLSRLLNIDKSEVVRRAINEYYVKHHTDASLLALAERLHCMDILSTDRRGFAIYKPRHVTRLNNLFFET